MRRSLRRIVNLIAIAAALAAAAPYGLPPLHAQAPDFAPLQRFTGSAAYRAMIDRALAGLPPDVLTRCPGLESEGSTVHVLQPVAFGPDGVPTRGLWLQSYPVAGCGNDTLLNVFVVASASGQVSPIVGVPGTTLADPILQRDALFYANMRAGILVKDCKAVHVRTSRFVDYGLKSVTGAPDPGPGQPNRPWRESWTMSACGRTVEVPLEFQPDATGTKIYQTGGALVP